MTSGDADAIVACLCAEDLAALDRPGPLTKKERAKVRSLVEDEGETLESATAWVRAFGATDEWFPVPQADS